MRLDVPPELPPEPSRGRKLLLRGGAIALALVVLGGATYVALRALGGSSDTSDTPRGRPPAAVLSPEPYRTPQGPRSTGGPTAQRVHAALRDAGFACGRIDSGRSAIVGCHRAEVRPAPVQHQVTLTLAGSQTAGIEVAVETDPAWRNVTTNGGAGGPDGGEGASKGTTFGESAAPVENAAPATFRLVAQAAVPQAERDEVNHAIDAAQEQSGLSIDTATYAVSVSTEPTEQRLRLRTTDVAPPNENEVGGPALAHVPLAKVEKVASRAGARCERGPRATTCVADQLRVRIGYADQRSIGEVQIAAPTSGGADRAPADRLVRLAADMVHTIARQAGDPALARQWVSERCFGEATHRLPVGAAHVSCSPEVTGSAEDYRVSRHQFRIGGTR